MNPSVEFKNIPDESVTFEGLKISEKWKLLSSVDERTICPKCNKSRKYFCYTCYVPVAEIEEYIPKVKLPLKIDIIKHAKEIDGKSTAAHAAILAPEDVNIFTYPCIPNYSPNENVILIYPNKDAYSVNDVIKMFHKRNRIRNDKSNNEEPLCKKLCNNRSSSTDKNNDCDNEKETSKNTCIINRAVFIDATWNQSKGICRDPRLKGLPCVVLKSRISQFWRHQKGSPRWYLATIEAVHQFLIELHIASSITLLHSNLNDCGDNVDVTDHASFVNSITESSNELNIVQNNNNRNDNVDCKIYKGEYDDLLFLFRFMYSKIHTLYNHDSLLSYKRPLE